MLCRLTNANFMSAQIPTCWREAKDILLKHCSTPATPPSPQLVSQCVQLGVNVLEPLERISQSLFHVFVKHGWVDCVRVSLEETKQSLCFMNGDDNDRTPLHLLCSYDVPEVPAASMLKLIVHRLEANPLDEVDWNQHDDDGDDFLSLAASHQRLSLFWPLVKSVPHFSDEVQPMPLRPLVWEWDWNALGEADQKFFQIVGEVEHVEKSTAALVQLCSRRYRFPSADDVQQLVQKGSDVCFLIPFINDYLLHFFILHGLVDCFKACLTTPRPIDFNRLTRLGNSLLHELCDISISENVSLAILEAIVQRVSTHPEDSLDWASVNYSNRTFFSLVASNQKLSLYWPVVKPLCKPLFAKQPVSIEYTWATDWNRVDSEDLLLFAVGKVVVTDEETAAMHCYYRKHMWDPDPAVLQEHVDAGADVTFCGPDGSKPLVFSFLSRGLRECFRVCLRTPRSIDWMMTGTAGEPLLHELCALPSPLACDMLELLIHRLEAHKGDRVDWEQVDSATGRSFLSVSSEWQKLQIFMPLLTRLPHFQKGNSHEVDEGTESLIEKLAFHS